MARFSQAAASSASVMLTSPGARGDPAVGELQVLGGRAEQVGGHRRQPVAQLARGVQDRVAGHVQLAGGERAAGRRVERAVADVDADVVQRRAEDLGGDLAQAGRLAGAEIGDAGRG